jgi:CDP-diacylglycerol--glycerol-3-phosphate 3-phosphatidyltransferase
VIDLACSAGLVALALVVGVFYGGRVLLAGPAHHPRVERAGGSPLLGKGAMEMGYWALRPVARGCVLLGISANGVSWASLGLAALAGIAVAAGHFGVGAVLTSVSSACDAIDGLVARESGTASESGEVLDAAVDRYGELFFLGGAAYFARLDTPVLVLGLAAIAGAMMVSYSTAKAESLGVVVPRGALRRQERAVGFVVGAMFVPLAGLACDRWHLPDWLRMAPITACLGLVAIVGNASAFRRLRAVAIAAHPLNPVGRSARADALSGEPGAVNGSFR